MKHPVGNPETRMLLLQILFNNYEQPETDTSFSFSLPQVTKWEGAAAMKKKWNENMGSWREKQKEIKLAANSLYAHSAYSKITAIIVISAFSFHSVKATLNSSRTLLAPVNLQLARGQPISSWCAAINDVYKEPCGCLDEGALARSVPYYWTQHRHTLPSCHAACRSAPSAITSHS